MSFAVLRAVVIAPSDEMQKDFLKQYQLFGEFYEQNTNRNGGRDYLARELENFLRECKNGEEMGGLKDYSHDLARMNILSLELINRSRRKYIQENYKLYRVYVRIS